ncbi:MAG: ATP-binding protein, partial [Endozoicomonadaceae bacterium]|nr:ATP-binding protein [Endozoicomonadaceae bacterium]
SRKLIQLFQFKETNPNQAQIMFSTHDTNLLVGDILRRDQIWFTEKSRDGSTVISPLTDINTRKGDNIENGYLQGRYGAIPYLGGLDTLFEKESIE